MDGEARHRSSSGLARDNRLQFTIIAEPTSKRKDLVDWIESVLRGFYQFEPSCSARCETIFRAMAHSTLEEDAEARPLTMKLMQRLWGSIEAAIPDAMQRMNEGWAACLHLMGGMPRLTANAACPPPPP